MKAMKLVVTRFALSLLIGGMTLTPSTVNAADWIGWVSGDDTYVATWVKDIERELNKKEYRAVFLNDPRTPQASVLRLLNQAAIAYNAKNSAVAEDHVRQAIEVFETGVRRHYYSQSDIEPIINYIRQHALVKAAA